MKLPYDVLGLHLSEIIHDNDIILADELVEHLKVIEGYIEIEEETK